MSDSNTSPADVLTVMLHTIDQLDWNAVRSCLADEVAIDYTSLWGATPAAVSASELVESWQQLLPGFDATQHLTGPVLVKRADDGTAKGETTVRGYHHVRGDRPGTWMVAGQYVVTFRERAGGWKVGGITLHLSYEDGDRKLVDVARERVAARRGGRTAGDGGNAGVS